MRLSLRTKFLLLISSIVLVYGFFSVIFTFFYNKTFFILAENDLDGFTGSTFVLAFIPSMFLVLSAGFLFIAIIYFVSKYLRPFQKISLAAKKISEGDYSVRLEVDHSSVEFDQLFMVFNKMIEDVETEKNKTEELTADLTKFKLAMDNASDHIVITDKDAIVLYVNKTAEKLTGYTFEESVGKKSGFLWGGLMSKDFYAKLWDTILFNKQSFHGEMKNHRKNGEEYDVVIDITPILDEKKEVKFFVGIERDITKEKEIDRAKTEFVSLASHQLRTPLSAIGWYTEMLLSGDAGKLNKEHKKYLLEIAEGNKRMVNLINSLLNVSRIEMGTFEIETKDVQIFQIAQQSLDELQAIITKKKIVLNKNFTASADTIKADPKLLKIIFDNLLSNAVKYTPAKGKIDFSIKKVKKEILISVKDTGIGIPKSQQHNIYTKLFRADNAQTSYTGGTGLGLYIVKSILDHAGGTISFASEENKGTEFIVSLPETGMIKRTGVKNLLTII